VVYFRGAGQNPTDSTYEWREIGEQASSPVLRASQSGVRWSDARQAARDPSPFDSAQGFGRLRLASTHPAGCRGPSPRSTRGLAQGVGSIPLRAPKRRFRMMRYRPFRRQFLSLDTGFGIPIRRGCSSGRRLEDRAPRHARGNDNREWLGGEWKQNPHPNPLPQLSGRGAVIRRKSRSTGRDARATIKGFNQKDKDGEL